MDVQNSIYRFEQASAHFPARIRDPLQCLPESVRSTASEIRLRVDKPVAVTCAGKCWFLDHKAQLHNRPGPCFSVTPEELEKSVLNMCSYSVHSHQNEMKDGYISLRGGHRAGVCGSAVVADGKITAVRDITSLNLRIARDLVGVSKQLCRDLFPDKRPRGVLIAGTPASGKTTILRDMARQLASGGCGIHKVAVVDERGELGAVFEGIPQNDLGANCDILSGYPKGEGILTAVRTMSPDVIVCDEVGGEADVTGMLDGLRCGVQVVASAHAGSLEELLGRRQIVRLLQEGAFHWLVQLAGADNPGEVAEMVEVEALRVEAGRYRIDRAEQHGDRALDGVQFVGEGAAD